MAIGFKIADGYVEVHAEVDDDQIRRTAGRASDVFDDEARRRADRGGEDSGRSWFNGFFRWLFRVHPTLSRVLPGWFELFANPITFAGFIAGGIWVASFLAAVLSSGLPLAVGAGFIALGAFILRENEKLKAEFDKTAKAAGESFKRVAQPMLLPFMGALKMIRDFFPKMEPVLKSIFAMLAPVIQPMTQALLDFSMGFLQGLEKAMPAIVEIMLAFAQELPDFGKALGEFFVYLAENKDTIIEGLRIIFSVLQIGLLVASYLLVGFTNQFIVAAHMWNLMTRSIYAAAIWLKENVPAALQAVGDFFVNLWKNISEFFKGLWNDIVEFFKSTGEAIKGALQAAWDGILETIGVGIGALKAIWEPFWSTFGDFFKAVWDFILASVDLSVVTIQAVIFSFLERLRATWDAVWLAVQTTISNAWHNISEGTKFVWNQMMEFLSFIWALIGRRIFDAVTGVFNFITGIWSRTQKSSSDAWNGIFGSISGALGKIWNHIWSTFQNILQFILNLRGAMMDAAKKMVQGIIDGITAMIGKVTEKIRELTRIIRDHLPGSPVKMGPLSGSHEPRHGGRKIAEMIAEGLVAGVPTVKAALNALVMPVAEGEGGTETAFQRGFDGPSIGSLTIILKGVWDFTNPTAAKKVVADIHDAIEEHKRGYATP